MAAARKCDRCGNLYEPYNTENNAKKINGINTVNIDTQGKFYSHKAIDLCPDCKDQFEGWLFAGKPVEKLKKEV